MGRALALLQLDRSEAALVDFDRAIELSPSFAQAYANRGILHDRNGRYDSAVADYRYAIQLDAKVGEGPGWLWKFMHSPEIEQSSLAERVTYIEAELKKPESERLLRVQEQDSQQQMRKK